MRAVSPGWIAADAFHVRVFAAREMMIDRGWAERGVCNTYWRYYVNSDDGSAVRLPDGSLFPLPMQAVHFIPAWVRFDCVTAVEVRHLFAHFDIVGLPGTLVREVFSGPTSLPFDAVLRSTSRAMREALADPQAEQRPHALFATKAAIEAALAMLFARLTPAQDARLSRALRSDSPLAPALKAIDLDVARAVRVCDLARLCGQSEGHFSRRFHQEMGQTPAQYVLERRVSAAAEQLVLGEDAIELIAERCGFPDRFYFTRVFTRRMGMPPAAYRRRAHEGYQGRELG
ncbi:MAG: helix-turn-helix transcriptional regulator [Planctomycetes bacterium]|nr:helix-turn-helix transcriptional regulator [Planctomycetota bacterium]